MSRKREERIRKHMSRCVNFNGIMNRVCDAGVDYDAQAGGKPALKKLPCLLDMSEQTVECPHAKHPTREEAIAEIEESDRHIREYMGKIANGKCPHCDSGSWSQVGRCVYCNGCNHRLYQGTLPREKRQA